MIWSPYLLSAMMQLGFVCSGLTTMSKLHKISTQAEIQEAIAQKASYIAVNGVVRLTSKISVPHPVNLFVPNGSGFDFGARQNLLEFAEPVAIDAGSYQIFYNYLAAGTKKAEAKHSGGQIISGFPNGEPASIYGDFISRDLAWWGPMALGGNVPDRIAIQSAVDSGHLSNLSGGNFVIGAGPRVSLSVEVPPGHYELDGTLFLSNRRAELVGRELMNAHLEFDFLGSGTAGDGLANIECRTTDSNFTFWTRVRRLSLDDLQASRSTSGQTRTMIWWSNLEESCRCEDLVIKSFGDFGVRVDQANTGLIKSVTCFNVHRHAPRGVFIYAGGVGGALTIENCSGVDQHISIAYLITSTGPVTLQNNHCENTHIGYFIGVDPRIRGAAHPWDLSKLSVKDRTRPGDVTMIGCTSNTMIKSASNPNPEGDIGVQIASSANVNLFNSVVASNSDSGVKMLSHWLLDGADPALPVRAPNRINRFSCSPYVYSPTGINHYRNELGDGSIASGEGDCPKPWKVIAGSSLRMRHSLECKRIN